MKKTMFLVLSFLMTTGCSMTNKSTLSAPVSVAAQSNLYASVEVGDPIAGTARATYFLGVFQMAGPDTYADGVFGGMAAGLKGAAAYDAISSSGAEIIVNPQYVIQTKGGLLFSSVTVDVTGYKGTISSIEDQGPGPMQSHQH